MSNIWDKLNNSGRGSTFLDDFQWSTGSNNGRESPASLKSIHDKNAKQTTPEKSSNSIYGNMTEKLLEKAFTAALPSVVGSSVLGQRLRRQKNRPPLSIQLTSRNFRKMTARTGIMFEIYYQTIEILNWEKPSLALSILLSYSFLCLNPRLIPVIPILLVAFGIMVPAYESRHPPELTELESNPVIATGPPLREAEIPKPVPEISREFYLNVVDTQNCMLDYVIVYDAISELLSTTMYFMGCESRSSMIYLLLLFSAVAIYFSTPLFIRFIPWKLIFLISGWVMFGWRYPTVHDSLFASTVYDSSRRWAKGSIDKFDKVSSRQFETVEPHEQREVEVFEVQHHDAENGHWEQSVYCSDPYCMLDKGGNLIAKASSLVDVLSPAEWCFADDAWKLDLTPETWTANRCLQKVADIDVDAKWVYDCNNGRRLLSWRRRRWVRICSRELK